MACPTCDHTMTGLRPGLFWCPRCGTVKDADQPLQPDMAMPKLVERCREFSTLLPKAHYGLCGDWMRLGIAEAIRP